MRRFHVVKEGSDYTSSGRRQQVMAILHHCTMFDDLSAHLKSLVRFTSVANRSVFSSESFGCCLTIVRRVLLLRCVWIPLGLVR